MSDGKKVKVTTQVTTQATTQAPVAAPAATTSARTLKNRKKKQNRKARQQKHRKNDPAADESDDGGEGNGWRAVDVSEMEIEGFEDGCVFELEELTDYKLQDTGMGGHILVSKRKSSGAGSNNKAAAKKQKKETRKSKAEKAKKEEKEDVEEETEEQDADEDMAQEPADEEEEQAEDNAEPEAAAEDAADDENENAPEEEDDEEGDEEEDMEEAQPEDPKKPRVIKKVNLPKWAKFKLHPLLLESLHGCGFMSPTAIQENTIHPALLDHRDIVGAAPTGSGKTLAFGLPILSQLLSEKDRGGCVKECKALILTPTRELALQISSHLQAMVPNREIGIATLVGGMAIQKQRRLLKYRPEIVIGTPGRLWDMINAKQEHLAELNETLRFFVIDEADRMLQKGAYPEVENIFGAIKAKRQNAAPDLRNVSDEEEDEDESEDEGEGNAFGLGGEAKVLMLEDAIKMHNDAQHKQNAAGSDDEDDEEKEEKPVMQRRAPRQTFLFSATLTIPEGGRFQKNGAKKYKNALTVLETVMKRVGLRGRPAVVDLSIAEKQGKKIADPEMAERIAKKQADNVKLSLPEGLELCQYEVTESTRDSFLYYFLTQYPGRTIVFLNAISQVRKLANLLSLLNLPVFALHAEMQQRQRLKKLDNFRAHAKGILIATDVAARGLDIPSVDYVVHYHIARSTEVFVHRSGRTARADKDGLSVSLVSPVDAKYHAQICKMLQRPTGLADFPLDHRYLPEIDERLRLAKSINEEDSVSGKAKSEETWFAQMAEAADLELDADVLSELKQKKQKVKGGDSIAAKRTALQRLLAQPLRPVGAARKFRRIHEELGSKLSGDGEYRKRNASEDLASKSKKSFKRFRRRK